MDHTPACTCSQGNMTIESTTTFARPNRCATVTTCLSRCIVADVSITDRCISRRKLAPVVTSINHTVAVISIVKARSSPTSHTCAIKYTRSAILCLRRQQGSDCTKAGMWSPPQRLRTALARAAAVQLCTSVKSLL